MYLICDIDGTLSVEPVDRRQAAEDGDWDLYYSLDFTSDEPKSNICSLVQAWLESGGVAIFVTSRSSSVRSQTEEWLSEHIEDFNNGVNSLLHMRDVYDMTPASMWKVKAVTDVCPKASAAMVWDDDHDACTELKMIGYSVMEVR